MALGVSHQQVQKYERGHNRISVDMLAEIAAILEVPISEFFISYDEKGNPLPGPAGLPVDIRLEIGRTARALHQLPPNIRRPILQLIDELSEPATPQHPPCA